MSAIEDIIRALGAAPSPPANWQRIILVGISAHRSIIADHARNGIDTSPEEAVEKLAGHPMIETHEFDGWAIRDCDERGKWHEVPVSFPPLRKPNESA